MFSSLNNSFSKNKNLFVIVFGLLTLSFILTLSDVSITDLGSGPRAGAVGAIDGDLIERDAYDQLAEKESIIISLERKAIIELNNSNSAHIEAVLSQTAIDRKIQKDIAAGTYTAKEIDTEAMRKFADENKLTPEMIKIVRTRLGVGGQELDEAIKTILTRRNYFESFEDRVTVDEAQVKAKAQQQNSTITLQAKTLSATEAMDEKLVTYFKENQDKFTFDDTLAAQVVRFAKSPEGKTAAEAFAQAVAKVKASNFAAVAKSKKLDVITLPKTRVSNINAGQLIENDFALSTAIIELSSEKPFSQVIEGSQHNYVAVLTAKGGVLPFAQVREQVIEAYFGPEPLQAFYNNEDNKRQFLIPRSLQLSLVSLSPSTLYSEVAVSEEEIKADYDKNIAEYKAAQIKSTEYSITAKDDKSLAAAETALKAIKVLVDSQAKNLAEELKKNTDIKSSSTEWVKEDDNNKALFALNKGKSTDIIAKELVFSFTIVNDKRAETPYAEASKAISSSITHAKASTKARLAAEKLQSFISSNRANENFFNLFLAEAAKGKFTERKLRPLTPQSGSQQNMQLAMQLLQQGYTPPGGFSQEAFAQVGQMLSALSATRPLSDPSVTQNGDIQYLLVERETPSSYVSFENAKSSIAIQVANAEGKVLAKAKADALKLELEKAEDMAVFFKSNSFDAEQTLSPENKAQFTGLLSDEVLEKDSAYITASGNNSILAYIKKIEAGSEDKVKKSFETLMETEKSRLAYEKVNEVFKSIQDSVTVTSK
ncbi:peptidylprolyl isomerase [Lentisphaera marina]|uniref:peptidylprolyl isomerase n=1 Tax=Lentisphaera marina TaxID=1111041 RepID=UPI002365006B|nr:peptidylprolyl isomerase [Lentisphaera marina]MDD7985992.1 peptidylprolyl isomerase [Lentisphaera marina]